MATGTIRKPMMNGYLPCFMVLLLRSWSRVRRRPQRMCLGCPLWAGSARSAGELLDRGVLLDRVSGLLHPGDELVRGATLVHQLVRGGTQFIVQLLVPGVETEAEGVGAGRRQRLVAGGEPGADLHAVGGPRDN